MFLKAKLRLMFICSLCFFLFITYFALSWRAYLKTNFNTFFSSLLPNVPWLSKRWLQKKLTKVFVSSGKNIFVTWLKFLASVCRKKQSHSFCQVFVSVRFLVSEKHFHEAQNNHHLCSADMLQVNMIFSQG